MTWLLKGSWNSTDQVWARAGTDSKIAIGRVRMVC